MTPHRDLRALTGDELFTIAIHYMRRIEDLMADEGDFSLATCLSLAIDDLAAEPWTELYADLEEIDASPLSVARIGLDHALSLLAAASPGIEAEQALLSVDWFLMPLHRWSA